MEQRRMERMEEWEKEVSNAEQGQMDKSIKLVPVQQVSSYLPGCFVFRPCINIPHLVQHFIHATSYKWGPTPRVNKQIDIWTFCIKF